MQKLQANPEVARGLGFHTVTYTENDPHLPASIPALKPVLGAQLLGQSGVVLSPLAVPDTDPRIATSPGTKQRETSSRMSFSNVLDDMNNSSSPVAAVKPKGKSK